MEPLDPVTIRNLNKSISKMVGIGLLHKPSDVKEQHPNVVSLKKAVRARLKKSSFSRYKDNADYNLTLHILESIKDATGYTRYDLEYTGRRNNRLVVARSLFVYLERNLNKRSYPDIAAIMSMDHTSCMYLMKKFASLRETNKFFYEFMNNDKLKLLCERAKWDNLILQEGE